ncbi:MAG TPA: ATP-dependent zinc metalloprotease FtsH [Chloroflexota bacterium]|jgi:cell division protease FtsH|nr:ATP-dependent zinc metalloprotease FtsH [Chloroflexota bacterium]
MDAKWLRNSFVYLVILVLLLAIAYSLMNRGNGEKSTNISQVMQYITNDVNTCRPSEKDQVTVDGSAVHLSRVQSCVAGGQDQKVVAQLGPNDSFTQMLKDANLPITAVDLSNTAPSQLGNWIQILTGWLPLLIFAGLIFFMMRQAQGSNNQALSFGKSRARMFTGNRPTVTFADVAGVEEAKQELAEVVDFLRYPEKFASLGARIPRGVLLVGSPGTGKTLLSRAVAGEAGVPFFSISGSEFVEMFVGVGASRVRDLFDQAKRNAPCIVFVDEIDAVGRQRGAGLGGSHDEREQTLNQILVEMDGFDTNTNVIVIAATNRPDVLDPALLRPGRFDRQVILDRPDIRGRKAVLEVHARGKPLEKNVSLEVLAKQTPGFSGADLANLLNEAAILAARRNKKVITMHEMEEAIDRVVAGPERKSRIISEQEKRITAYHEVGHALVAHMVPNLDPLHKVTIIARGMAGGFTQLLPTEDRYLYTRSHFEDTLAFSLGGQAAEMLIFGEMTTGAENDIERATKLARKMVTEYGMSDKLGPLAYGHKEEMVFLGRDLGEQRNYSEVVAVEIDGEVRRLVTTAYARAREILEKHRDKLVLIAERLVQEETLDSSQFETLLGLTAVEPTTIASSRMSTGNVAARS